MAEKCLTDYLGDKNLKSLNDEPFNEIDGVVLSKISNLHLEDAGINMGNGKSKTIADVFDNIKNKDSYLNMPKDDRKFFELVATNPRYKKMELSNFVCDPVKNDVHRDIFYSVGAGENKEQFAAVTIKYTQNGKTCNFVSYRATDSSLQGWLEDLAMLDSPKTQAQSDSVAYMNYIAQHTQGDIVGGGHSKGGNDFEYAYLFCDEEAKNRIEKGYVYDSPGLMDNVIDKSDRYNDYKKITKGNFLCPEDSIIGQILFEADNGKFVKSTAKDGFHAHEPTTWIMNYDEKTGKWSFSYGEQSQTSKDINKITDMIVKELSPEEREVVIDLFCYILYTCGEDNMNDVIKRFSNKLGGKTDAFTIAKLIYDELIANGNWDHLTPRQKVVLMRLAGKAIGYGVSEYVNSKWSELKKQMGLPGIAIDIIENGINSLIKNIEKIAGPGPLVKGAYRFLNGVRKYAFKAVKKFFKGVYDKYFNKGKKYAKSHTYIYIDTQELTDYSVRLSKVNGRLVDLDDKLGKLYKKLSPVNQQRLQSADMSIGSDKVVSRSAKFLRDVADLFAEAEAEIDSGLR